jgi:hypothetical protein
MSYHACVAGCHRRPPPVAPAREGGGAYLADRTDVSRQAATTDGRSWGHRKVGTAASGAAAAGATPSYTINHGSIVQNLRIEINVAAMAVA